MYDWLQIVYGEGAEFYTLYVVALKDEQRKEWIEELREGNSMEMCEDPFLWVFLLIFILVIDMGIL